MRESGIEIGHEHTFNITNDGIMITFQSGLETCSFSKPHVRKMVYGLRFPSYKS
jgi:hypothetical protein